MSVLNALNAIWNVEICASASASGGLRTYAVSAALTRWPRRRVIAGGNYWHLYSEAAATSSPLIHDAIVYRIPLYSKC